MLDPLPELSAAQAAARLGIKQETLYAYVSRGLLRRTRTSTGSRFDAMEVERFAERRARRPPSAPTSPAASPGTPLMVVDTDVALIDSGELFYRGRRAAELATTCSYDAVAAWIWGEAMEPGRTLRCSDSFVAPARRLVQALPPTATLLDRVAVAVHGLACADPLRDDISPGRLAEIGEILTAGIPRALASAPIDGTSIAGLLWGALAPGPPRDGHLAALNAALVLSIDHDLAISTFAARVAASARAPGYAVISAALGAFDSPLHGNASRESAELLRAVLRGVSPDRAIRDQLRRRGRGVPGFGHPLYPDGDPRARALQALVADLPDVQPVLGVSRAVEAVMADLGLLPNIDFALATLVVASGLPSDAGAVVFALGRIAGWMANAMAEYEAPPLRLRPRGRYTGPDPSEPTL
ncbi:citrate/2-methylcitrate synthase [Amnibacterium sp. CER49]|uniref:citrate synthase n=1 Tax=Amnibacterium sp. CER49 TaxID=3039161 RepID=UPI002448718B|nr:citrate/2-methylcitrate synthase [Amnibacterium sp. CER49]MDH2443510.1 citrate/2-methylcitrate synthase [Amnibacterium sp. CER49]